MSSTPFYITAEVLYMVITKSLSPVQADFHMTLNDWASVLEDAHRVLLVPLEDNVTLCQHSEERSHISSIIVSIQERRIHFCMTEHMQGVLLQTSCRYPRVIAIPESYAHSSLNSLFTLETSVCIERYFKLCKPFTSMFSGAIAHWRTTTVPWESRSCQPIGHFWEL